LEKQIIPVQNVKRLFRKYLLDKEERTFVPHVNQINITT